MVLLLPDAISPPWRARPLKELEDALFVIERASQLPGAKLTTRDPPKIDAESVCDAIDVIEITDDLSGIQDVGISESGLS